jgi:hypothetical protein
MSTTRRHQPSHRRLRLAWSSALVAVLAIPVAAAPAHAAPPPNDGIAAATAITSVPTQLTVDTTEATSDAADGRCVDGHSVWFRLRPSEDRRVAMTTAGSSFNTRLAVFRGPRDNRDLVDCNNNSGPGTSSSVRFRAEADQRYWVAVSSVGTGPGGSAMLTVGRVAAPAVTVAVDSATSGAVSGRLHLHGTVTCPTPSQLWMGGVASQRIESDQGLDGVARGFGSDRVGICWTEPVEWHMRFDSDTGLAFQPGPASIGIRIRGWDGIARFGRHVDVNVVAEEDPVGRLAP